ncbi:phosphopantetheine-binding protein [Streptomyces tubercidicus]|uniref:phosphopantetheine-binding protein n=1 Tax=Streptomyces tubercidicus TaxID=47759 RepID=UPI0034653C25
MTTTETQQIKDHLVAMMSEKFGLPESELRSGATFEELDIDSLILVELGLLLRKKMGVVLAEGELKPTHTMDDAAAVVESKGPRV